MPAFQTASYYTRPKIKTEDIELGQSILDHIEHAVALAIDSLMADPFYGPRAMFACSYVGSDTDSEPASTLLVTFPLVNPDEPAELRVDLEEIVNEVLWMHRYDDGGGGFDPEAREAITAIADMLDAQAQKLRTALSEEPTRG
ncbi:hypothetical protein U5801_11655 [Lamprobacter modestohalophilus]|uniref:hypothetical protein n=1 Tax=Lamprobacter modestohalophilus TaxID=1064514 RepID=UPI002ADEE7B0|nr:hypothetical protein [Lamprobacter modestohalophilus]MEA1050459.1 hypothetical protein [Lamprobacter modestohalophilus]